MKFDIRQTNIAKGFALLLLLWHHVFYKSKEYYGLFHSVYRIDGIPIECIIARYFKVCVALYFFLSGYGMYKSWQKTRRNNPQGGLGAQARFVKNHLIKLLMDFWYIYLIFVPLGIAFGVYFWEVYKGSFLNGALDFFCLSFFPKTPTMNPTWWFLAMIVAFYLLMPLLGLMTKKMPWLTVTLALFFMLVPNGFFPRSVSRITEWIPPLFFGMAFAEGNLFERVQKHFPKLWQGVLLTIPAMAFFAWHRYKTGEGVRFDALFALSILFFCYLVLSRIPGVSRALAWLGSYSGPIYMFHTFVYLLYGKPYIYGLRYSPLIYLGLLGVCIVIAIALKYFKKLIRYDKLTAKASGR